ncbi:M48 family metalloprotease [Mesorhizobium sp. M0664]|uniref:M48 family metalloprotease n=1 Tax=Mesorhizobium sp. M0664 TaxID=2956982 RepID=UPI00333A51AC
MTLGAFLDDVKPLAARYLTATALRLGWYAINSGLRLYPSVVLPLPPHLYWPGLFVLVDLGLTIWQVVLLIKVVKAALIRYQPNTAATLHLTTAPGETQERDLTSLSRTVVSTPLVLAGTVLFTCVFIQWLIMGGPLGVPFVSMPLDSPGWVIGGLLAVAGLVYGNRFTARAKARVGNSFGVEYLQANHPLAQRVAGHAATLGIKPPAVGVVNVTNAFAMGTRKDAAVVIGKPLLNLLSPQELDAVIGHELGHVVYNDVERMQFAEGFQTMMGHVANFGTIIATTVVAQATKDKRYGRDVTEVTGAMGTAARHTLFAGSELMVKGLSRAREFKADAIGASIASPEAMIGALERVHGIPAKPTGAENKYGYLMFRGGKMGALFSTHPTLKRRTDALRSGAHLKMLPGKKAA